MRPLLLVIFLLAYVSAAADYFVASRNANLRAEPSTESEILEKVKKGDTLLIVSPGTEGGYYHVTSIGSGQEGWIYRTLVRRVQGDAMVHGLAGPAAGNVVDIRVLDVGAGLCNLIQLPGNKYVIYDAGGKNTSNGNETFAQIKDYIPLGSPIELMILSHTDADHIVAAEQVIRN